MRKDIEKLLASDLTSNKIATESDVTPSKVYRLRSGETKLDNITLAVAEKLYEYQKEMEMNEMGYSITGSKGDDYNLEIIDEKECKTYVQAEREAEKMSRNKEIDNIEIMVTGKHADETSYWHPREGASMTNVNWKDEFENGYTPK